MQKKGIFTWFGFVLEFEDKLRLIKEAGFETICSWWGDDFSKTDGNYLGHPELADRYGLYIEHAHIPYYGANRIWYDNLDGESLFDQYIQDIKDAGLNGVNTLVVHPFEKHMPDTDTDRFCLERFRRLGDIAVKYDVKIAVENLADNKVLRKILNYAQNPYIGLCFDSGHNNIVAHNDFSLISDYGDRIHALHLHDNYGQEDQHRLPFEGNIDWESFLLTIQNTQYNKSFMLESSHPFVYHEEDTEYNFNDTNQSVRASSYLTAAFSSCVRAIHLQKGR